MARVCPRPSTSDVIRPSITLKYEDGSNCCLLDGFEFKGLAAEDALLHVLRAGQDIAAQLAVVVVVGIELCKFASHPHLPLLLTCLVFAQSVAQSFD